LDIDGKRVTEPFKFLIGISWIGEIQVELIQPVYGPMIYEAFIQKHGEGLHHFKERISEDDIDEVLQEYRAKGIEVTQTGQFKEDSTTISTLNQSWTLSWNWETALY
jgi:methylmalonyl-CoA/ethylmalonyl-CoA epimerase